MVIESTRITELKRRSGVNSIVDYKKYNKERIDFDLRYRNDSIVDTTFFNEHGFIYKYTEGLNLKPNNSTELPTGLFKNAGFHNSVEIIAYELEKPYKTFTIDFPIGIIHKGNVIEMLLKYLIQFQQINYTYSKYDLGNVYDDAVIRIQEQTGLLPNYSEIKVSIIEKSVKEFNDTVEGVNVTSVSEVVNTLGLYKTRTNFVYSGSYMDGRALLLSAISIQKSSTNDAKINDCINCMQDAEMYVNGETVKEQLFDTGLRQIKKVISTRKQEIKDYNYKTFGVKSYIKWKSKYEFD